MTADNKQRTTARERHSIRREANEVFGSKQAAQNWYNYKNPFLDGAKPKDEVQHKEGAERVKTLLGQIKYGVYS